MVTLLKRKRHTPKPGYKEGASVPKILILLTFIGLLWYPPLNQQNVNSHVVKREFTSMAFLDYVKKLIVNKGKATSAQGTTYGGFYDKAQKTGSGVPFAIPGYNPQTNLWSDAASQQQYADFFGVTPSGGVGGGGAGGGGAGGGGAGTANPTTTALQQDILGKISALQGTYNTLFSNQNQYIGEQANQAIGNYGQQAENLGQTYGKTTGQLANIYGARGLGSSSYQTSALEDAASTYGQNLDQIIQNQTGTLGQIGQYAATARLPYQNVLSQYQALAPNLGQYSPSDLQSLQGSLTGSLQDATSAAAGVGTNQKFMGGLQAITPIQNQGTAQLAAQLQRLTTSSAPIFAKKQIAAGLIKAANLQDPNAVNYWQNYWQQLLAQGT